MCSKPHPFQKPLWILSTLSILILTAVLLVSCASLSKKQCLAGEWQSIGVKDALYGRPQSRFEQHVKACQKVNIVPDRAVWLAGHKQGARSYCRPSNAYDEGRRGSTYYNICEPDQHAIFVPIYNLGYKEYSLIRRRDSAEAELARYEKDLIEFEEMLRRAKIDSDQSDEDLRSRRRKIKFAREHYADAVDDLANFRRRLQFEGVRKMAGL